MQKPIPTCRDPWARWAKIILAIAVCATLLALAGCAPRTAGDAKSAIDPVLYVDQETGCHYLSTGQFSGITPRMDRDGKQVCK